MQQSRDQGRREGVSRADGVHHLHLGSFTFIIGPAVPDERATGAPGERDRVQAEPRGDFRRERLLVGRKPQHGRQHLHLVVIQLEDLRQRERRLDDLP